MVFLAITKNGLVEALSLAKENNEPVWCTSNAVSEEEFKTMSELNITRFDYSFVISESEILADALSTIQEHHPGKKIWVEGSDEL